VHVGLGVARLVGDEQLDRGPEGRIGEAAGRRQRLERLAEVGREKRWLITSSTSGRER